MEHQDKMKNRSQVPSFLPCAIFCAAIFALFAARGMAATFNVRDYGAEGDKTNDDTPAIQAAIDACQKAGGGDVLVPAGNYFAGKIVLKSNVTLKLENGATIWASGDITNYDPNPKRGEHGYLFVASGQKNIVIAGSGKIVGAGQADLGRRAGEVRTPPPAHRFGIIHFTDCQTVRFSTFSIRFSEAHAIVLSDCEDVVVSGISILNNFFRVNSDGIDPVSCTNVFISNCHIVAGDDCICPKAENGRALENLVVDNCVLESVSAAFKLGTASSGDFRDVQVSNCIIRNSGVGLGLFIKDGGTVEDVSFSNISIETTRPDVPINSGLRNSIIPIYIDLTKRDPDSPLSRIRDVSFSDIQIVSDNSIVIQGLPERAIENLTLRDITFRVNHAFNFSKRAKREGGKSTYRDANRTRFVRQPTYCALAYVNGLTVNNLRVLIPDRIFKEFPRSAVSVFNSENGVIENVHREPTGVQNGPPPVTLSHCQQIDLEAN
jgi:polygalacturonase